jgi:predicted amidohydrolase YtcJ
MMRAMTADWLFRNGTIRTDDPARPLASALAVRDGRISGLDDAAVAQAGPGTVEVDLDGGVLLPSFGDGHVHPLWGGVELSEAPVRDARSVDEVVAAVAQYAAEHPELAWVTGGSYDPTLAPGGLFDARWLDAAVPDRPVFLESSDHHSAWVNTEALRRAGVTAVTADPPAATVAKRDDGEPLGTLVEWTAMDLVKRLVPAPGPATKRAGLQAATALLAAAGVTWAQEAALAPADVATYLAAADAGQLAVRVNIALRAEPGEWPEQRAAFAAARAAAKGHPQVSARTVKFFADGVLEFGTAALLKPYANAPHTCGLPVWSPQELAEAVTAFDADGFQVHIHAIGDAGVRAALDAVEHAERVNGPRDRRAVVAHTQVVDPTDLPRFAALGVIANFEPLWACLDDCQLELTAPRLGPDRSRLQYPMRSLADSGALLSMGSDWPVSSLRPMEGLAVAVSRQDGAGQPAGGWIPGERLDVATALRAYSAGVAFQGFEESLWGRLDVGMRADLVALAVDPFAAEPGEWASIPVRGTWLGGVRTHDGS